MTLTIEDIRAPHTQGGYKFVKRYTAQMVAPKGFRASAQKASDTGRGSKTIWTGPRRDRAEDAAQDYCDWYNGQPVVRVVGAIADLAPRERRRVLTTAVRKTGFPAAMRKAIIARDRVCQECGVEFPYLECDHIDPDGPHSLENGQALCPNCHTIKTREDDPA